MARPCTRSSGRKIANKQTTRSRVVQPAPSRKWGFEMMFFRVYIINRIILVIFGKMLSYERALWQRWGTGYTPGWYGSLIGRLGDLETGVTMAGGAPGVSHPICWLAVLAPLVQLKGRVYPLLVLRSTRA